MNRPLCLPNPIIMKIILLLITVLFSSMAVTSCTNEEGETEFDHITPDEEQQTLLKSMEAENVN